MPAVSVLIIGAGQRGTIYTSFLLENPHLGQAVGIAEPQQSRREAWIKTVVSKRNRSDSDNKHSEDPTDDGKNEGSGTIANDALHIFGSYTEITSKIADAVIICTQDHDHIAAIKHLAPLVLILNMILKK
jgi:predicted dehydrogenase